MLALYSRLYQAWHPPPQLICPLTTAKALLVSIDVCLCDIEGVHAQTGERIQHTPSFYPPTRVSL
jgi:hypothetical protein